jgi:predicted TIM-barrel fold metal-dependent hydrolase
MDIIDAHVSLGRGEHLSLDVGDLLSLMDEAHIAQAVATSVDRFVAVDNREGNDFLLSCVRQHPDRIVGLAAVNPWYGQRAVAELRRALDEGLLGLFLYPNYQGFRLSDHIVDPLLEVVAELDLPVYAHSGTAGIAEPLHVTELARRFPSVNFIMGHGGSSDYGEDAVRALEFADNVWLETSRNGPANFNFWKVRNVWSRAVFGSSTPEYIPAIEIETLCDIFQDDAQQEAILARNIRRVFKGRLGS